VSLASLMSRPCVIIRRDETGGTDRYGNPDRTETLVETTCELQQLTRDEPDASGEVSKTLWRAFFPVDTVLLTDDAVEVDGDEYELDGDPWTADTGNAAVHHVEATLVRTAGAEDSS
jgi:hypothetical protein